MRSWPAILLLYLALIVSPARAEERKAEPPESSPARRPLLDRLFPSARAADRIAARFQQLDVNNDGKLSPEELKDHPQIQALLRGADRNQDNFLTLEEIRVHLGRPAAKPEAAKTAAESTALPNRDDAIREGPRRRAGGPVGVGRFIPDAAFIDIDGRKSSIRESIGKQGLVIALTNTSCPICKKYAPTLAELERSLAAHGIAILYVNPTPNETAEGIQVFHKAHRLTGRYVQDRDGELIKLLDATTTAEVFLLDRSRTLVYRGAIDDQYGLGYSLEAPRNRYLAGAVTALLAGRQPDPAATTAPGCALQLGESKTPSPRVTYHNRISRIVQANCVECHRKGGVAPFSLENYEDVVAHRGMIRKVVEKGTMPPWFAAPPAVGEASPWINDRSLPSRDRDDLLAWLTGDRAVGDPNDAPQRRTIGQDGWAIGKPDLIYQLPKPIAVPATGTMPYQNVTVDTQLPEDRWVQALEVRPTARSVVHHVLVFAMPPGESGGDRPRDSAADERAGFFAIYVPGNSMLVYPDGFAKKLPRGARLRFQMHYTPDGTATTDQTQLGLVLAKEPPRHEVQVFGIVNTRFAIPPGANNHSETAHADIPFDVRVLGFLPHMHLRGKAFRYDLAAADGSRRTLLDIPRYDFNWQLLYRYAEPIAVTRGSKIEVTGWFDNSADNPANPDPKKTVRWGPQTYDEMLLGYVEYYSTDPNAPRGGRLAGGPRFDPADVFRRVDRDSDGKISRAEFEEFAKTLPRGGTPARAKILFDWLDADRDGLLSLEELKRARDRSPPSAD